MNATTEIDKLLSIQLLILSFICISVLFIWQGNKGFSLQDEGFLWYGVQRVMLGEVPIRDFMAYDPGRYYWSAAVMSVFRDNGIMSLRAAVAIFQALGLFAGLLLIAGAAKHQGRGNILFLSISAATLVLWMFPRHKLFDISLSILLISTLTFLVRNPTATRYFITGICIGLVAVFGRNHGMYGIAGSLGVMAWLSIRRSEGTGFNKGFILWAAGVIAGFTPILLMALLVPGFAVAFWESIRFLFEQKTTNLPLPVPWPWKVDFSSVSSGQAIRGVLMGLFFIGVVAFGVLSVLWVVYQKRKGKPVQPVLVAASFLALPYAHFAYSRADAAHLAQGIFPLLVGGLALLSTRGVRGKWPPALALCAASFWVMHVNHPGWQCQGGKQCVNVEISGDNLQISRRGAGDIAMLQQLAAQYAPAGQSFIATPFWPGAYALLERKSPMWEIYALFPRSEAFEKKEIERIKAAEPGFAVVVDLPIDGSDELRFRNTHPLIHQYILEHFDRLSDSPAQAYQIFKAKEGA